jgi:ribosome-associated toxin RatA of RatAB toxin-antitoxin module
LNNNNKILSYFIILTVITLIVIISMNFHIGNYIIPEEIVIKTHSSETFDVDKKKIFEAIANIENYPIILPKNVISVEIINKTNNIIYANEEVSEKGIKVNLMVKHVIEPYDKHIMEILSGDAKGTTITQTYETVDSGTQINTDAEIKLSGILVAFGFTAEHNISHAIDTATSEFVEFVNQIDNDN